MTITVPTASIITNAQKLIQTPSQVGVDPKDVFALQRGILEDMGLKTNIFKVGKKQVALTALVEGKNDGPKWCLNACIDTASVDQKNWSRSPHSGVVDGGKLWGRGAADSKTGVAILSHVAAALNKRTKRMNGSLLLAFDAYEHDGSFRGISEVINQHPDIAGAMIGYSGSKAVHTGARGFFRTTLRVNGKAKHSGSRQAEQSNPTAKAFMIGAYISERAHELDEIKHDGFPLGPQLLVTDIRTPNQGKQFGVTPESVEIDLSFRVTPEFTASTARSWIDSLVGELDLPKGTVSFIVDSEYPAYQLHESSILARQLLESAREYAGARVQDRITGCSNVGNVFARHNIDATCGFGVIGKGVHAANENADIESIDPAYSAYYDATSKLLGMHPSAA